MTDKDLPLFPYLPLLLLSNCSNIIMAYFEHLVLSQRTLALERRVSTTGNVVQVSPERILGEMKDKVLIEVTS